MKKVCPVEIGKFYKISYNDGELHIIKVKSFNTYGDFSVENGQCFKVIVSGMKRNRDGTIDIQSSSRGDITLHGKFKGRIIKEITEEEYISNVFLEAI